MSLSRADHIEPKTIENDITVKPGLQIGEMTLKEHQDYLVWMKSQRKLTRSEAIIAGHRPDEIYAYFGPLIEELKGKPSLELIAKEVYEHFGSLSEELKGKPSLELVTLTSPQLEGFRQLNEQVPSQQDKFIEAKARGYTGDACPDCGSFTMLNNGTCLVCDNCGRTTGCS